MKLIKNTKITWALFENGYIHTDGLTEADANEMLERYTRIFPQHEYYILNLKGRS